MRAILQTENPDALPEELVGNVNTVSRHDGPDETFVTVEGIAGVGVLATGEGVRIWHEEPENYVFDGLDSSAFINFGGEDDDFSAELVACGEDGTRFDSEEID